MAENKRTSAKRTLAEPVEGCLDARKAKAFFDLTARFRAATDAEEGARPGDELGRMVLGG